MLQTLNFSGGRTINAKAKFLRYESGSAGGADESIRVRASGNDLGIYYPGDAIELDEFATSWQIEPTTTGCAGIVRLGMGRVQSARLVGTVQVIDNARSRTMANRAFMVGGGVTSPVDGTAHLVLSHPAGSEKRIVIGKVGIYAFPTGGSVLASVHLAQGPALTGQVLIRNAPSKLQLSGASPNYSVAGLYGLSSAGAVPGVVHSEHITLVAPSGGISREIELAEPWVLRPGTAAVIRATPQTAGNSAQLTGWFEFTEEPDT